MSTEVLKTNLMNHTYFLIHIMFVGCDIILKCQYKGIGLKALVGKKELNTSKPM